LGKKQIKGNLVKKEKLPQNKENIYNNKDEEKKGGSLSGVEKSCETERHGYEARPKRSKSPIQGTWGLTYSPA